MVDSGSAIVEIWFNQFEETELIYLSMSDLERRVSPHIRDVGLMNFTTLYYNPPNF